MPDRLRERLWRAHQRSDDALADVLPEALVFWQQLTIFPPETGA